MLRMMFVLIVTLGTYAIKPKLPAVGGNEGFGQVIKVGNKVKNVKEGDFVILAENSLG